MSDSNSNNQQANVIGDAVAKAFQVASEVSRTASTIGETFVPVAHKLVEQGTETVGQIVTPIAEHPAVKYATKIPGIKWLMAALGQVNVEKVHTEVEELKKQYHWEKPEQLARRVITDTAWKASGVGLFTNLVPPLALVLFPIDIAAVTALQAEMIYRIADIYGFSLEEPARRGEILAIWGLSTGSSGIVKAGFSILEIIPVFGTFVGVASDAALLTFVGNVACQYYETKLKSSKNEITIS